MGRKQTARKPGHQSVASYAARPMLGSVVERQRTRVTNNSILPEAVRFFIRRLRCP